MLDIGANYHCIHFKEIMNQTWKNGKKPSFGRNGWMWVWVGVNEIGWGCISVGGEAGWSCETCFMWVVAQCDNALWKQYTTINNFFFKHNFFTYWGKSQHKIWKTQVGLWWSKWSITCFYLTFDNKYRILKNYILISTIGGRMGNNAD